MCFRFMVISNFGACLLTWYDDALFLVESIIGRAIILSCLFMFLRKVFFGSRIFLLESLLVLMIEVRSGAMKLVVGRWLLCVRVHGFVFILL